jgi:threonylcarbamoyladenosine tRNA methylthiotransferase MtaB
MSGHANNGVTQADGGFSYFSSGHAFRTRAFLKIQDGCDNGCAYCAVPLARGPSVSLSAETALARLAALEAEGFKEAVLTGVNICKYNAPDAATLDALIALLLSGTSGIAIRLSSLEPDFITDGFASALVSPRVRPHFHLALQSGSDRVLQAMGRRYTSETARRACALLRSVKADPFMACDVITGFPGESEADFRQTLGLCAELDFAWIHAFPFSPRPGTRACSMPGRVSERDASARVAALTRLAESGKQAYIARWQGKTVRAIVQGSGNASGLCGNALQSHAVALSENYLKLELRGSTPLRPGDEVSCVLGVNADADVGSVYDNVGGREASSSSLPTAQTKRRPFVDAAL